MCIRDRYSLVTTKAAKRAIQKHKKFLSLPLSTNDGRSLLEFDFLLMDTKKSRMMAKLFMKYLRSSGKVHVTTPAGTDMMFYKENRNPGFFNGVLKDGKGYSSSSIEVYVPIEETKTEGIMVLDGSLGYIGRADEPTRIIFKGGSCLLYTSGKVHPSTGYIKAEVNGKTILDKKVRTDLEEIWDVYQSEVLPDCRRYIEEKTGGTRCV